jgi:hypothetical protein
METRKETRKKRSTNNPLDSDRTKILNALPSRYNVICEALNSRRKDILKLIPMAEFNDFANTNEGIKTILKSGYTCAIESISNKKLRDFANTDENIDAIIQSGSSYAFKSIPKEKLQAYLNQLIAYLDPNLSISQGEKLNHDSNNSVARFFSSTQRKKLAQRSLLASSQAGEELKQLVELLPDEDEEEALLNPENSFSEKTSYSEKTLRFLLIKENQEFPLEGDHDLNNLFNLFNGKAPSKEDLIEELASLEEAIELIKEEKAIELINLEEIELIEEAIELINLIEEIKLIKGSECDKLTSEKHSKSYFFAEKRKLDSNDNSDQAPSKKSRLENTRS